MQTSHFSRVGGCETTIFVEPAVAKPLFLSSRRVLKPHFCRVGGPLHLVASLDRPGPETSKLIPPLLATLVGFLSLTRRTSRVGGFSLIEQPYRPGA